jgi:hypothetical protein
MKDFFRSTCRNSWVEAIFLTLSFLITFPVFAQVIQDPNLDQVPEELREKIRLGNTGNPLQSSVITIDNWDNYALGIDFAESTVAAHPGNPAWFFTAYNINETHHTENGLDWNKNNPVWTGMAGDPVVAYDSIGNLYYINLFGSPVSGAKVVRSETNGQTWETPVLAATGTDKCWIACDQTNGPYANSVYVCMSNNNTGYFARSTDHGQSFENTVNFTTENLPGMSVCVGPYLNITGGSVYVVTNSGDPFASTYTFYRSVNGGVSFTQMSSQQFAGYVGTDVSGRSSVEGMRTRPYPFIIADNSYGTYRGRLYCVYASNDPPGDGHRPDIWCRFSTNSGTTWSDAIRVNDDVTPESNHQWHPAIWCDKQTGRLYIQWMDTRDTPTHDSAFIYGTWSDDGGNTFKTNQKISNKKMKIDCPSCGGSGTPRYQGDYNGIVSNKKVSLAGWTDFRNGTFMSATSYFPDFSMALDKTLDSLYAPSDSTEITISIPGTKLYSDTVLFSATVTPVPSQGSLIVSFPDGDRLLTFPGSTTARIKVSGEVPLGYYTVVLQANGPNGTPVHVRELILKIQSTEYIWVSANAIPPSVCPGSSSQLIANAQGGTGPYSYSWIPATGLSNPYIQNPVASPTVTTTYHVSVSDTGGHSAVDSVLVSVINAPSTPGPIIGQDSICRDSTVIFSISAVPAATSYSWTVPAGSVIIGGQNTQSIEVKWGTPTGIVSVIAGNSCGNSNPSVKLVAMIEMPAVPGPVIGPDTVCQSEVSIYSVDPVSGAKGYFWTIPEGSVISVGQNTNSITIIPGQISGNISVYCDNDCGESDPVTKFLEIDALPGTAGNIAGQDTVCPNHSGFNYSVADIPNTETYIWVLPSGAYITSGDSTRSIMVNFNPYAVTGSLSVHGLNACGTGTSSSKTIIVKDCVGIEESGHEADVTVFPNPSTDILNVRICGMNGRPEIVLMNMNGLILFRKATENTGHETTEKIDVSAFPGGVYMLKVINDSRVIIKKIILSGK